MEILLLILLTGAILVAIPGKSGGRKRPSKRSSRPEGSRVTDRPVFNPRTARPQAPDTILQGPAFVVDGDTIIIRKTRIRLFGVDAPEMNHPYGKKAKWALVSLCKGRSVKAEITEMDRHGRTVAKCFLPDGRDLSAEMVRLGLALDWAKYSGGRYQSLELAESRKKLWLADARQKGRMHVWEKFEARQTSR